MRAQIIIILTLIFLIPVSAVLAADQLTITSAMPAEVYVNDAMRSFLQADQPMDILLENPGDYVIELRPQNSPLIYREEITVEEGKSRKKVIQAFFPPAPAEAKVAPPSLREPPVTRAELQAVVQKAKSEALAEEAARRKRQQKREITNKALIHLIAVEGRRMPGSVKNMERIKLLGDVLQGIGGNK